MAGPDRTDSDLIKAMSVGDEGALRLLYERHAGWISARLRRRCANRDVVADVLQDTFVAAWNGAAKFRGDGEVCGWLWGIAARRLVSRMRLRSSAAVGLGPALLAHDATDVSAEETVLLTLQYSDLGSALARISPELRVVLQATVLDGLTTREAAQLLVDGSAGPVLAASLEAHLMKCATCRALTNALAFDDDLETTWRRPGRRSVAPSKRPSEAWSNGCWDGPGSPPTRAGCSRPCRPCEGRGCSGSAE